MVPQAPLKGVAGLPGSPERWDVLLSSRKEPGLDTGTLGVWSQEIREGVSGSTCVKGGRRCWGSGRSEMVTCASERTAALWTAPPEL